MRIAVVERREGRARTVLAALRALRHAPTGHQTVAEVRAAYPGEDPDVVLLSAPDADEVLTAARSWRAAAGPGSWLIALVDAAWDDDPDTVIAAGIDDVLPVQEDRPAAGRPELALRLAAASRVRQADHAVRAHRADVRRLEKELGRGAHARAFSEVVEAMMDRIAAAGPYLPSLYLLRGGRLRCVGVRGYWQILDGIVPGASVIGKVIAQGTPALVGDVSSRNDFLAAQQGLQAEIAVPIRYDGQVLGALNVESSFPMDAQAVGWVHACAAELEAQLAVVGGPPQETAAERLGYHITALAGLTDAAAVEREALEAAIALSGMRSGMIAIQGEDGHLGVTARQGPLGDRLAAMAVGELDEVFSWVTVNTSCYSHGIPGQGGFLVYGPVRSAGAQSVVVLALLARGQRPGFLLCGDEHRLLLSTVEVERLELLASQTAVALLTVSGMADLRRRATRDPLTGLGNRTAFAETVARRGAQAPALLAVAMIDLDGFKAVNDTQGHLAGDEVLVQLAAALASTLRNGDDLFRIGGDELAAVFDVFDERDAVAVGERLCAAARSTGRITVSIGIAVVPAGQPDLPGLLAIADEALYAVKRRGRDGVEVTDLRTPHPLPRPESAAS